MKRALFALLLTGCSTPTTTGPCSADSQCAPPTKCCGGKCVDLLSSPSHCGACGAPCGAQHGAAKCTAGLCSVTCSSGFGDCNQQAADGCETTLGSTAEHCGMCGKACTGANASYLCERGVCLQSSCKAGFGNCNGTDTDGCEVDVRKSLDHCGECGKKCGVPDGEGACVQGQCLVASCKPNFGDCDGLQPNGCETDLLTTLAHCSACGMACGAGYKCQAGKCLAPELLFFGGALSVSTTLATGVVSSFNVDTHAWSAISITGPDTPGNRLGHVAVWDQTGNRMLVWGGFVSGFTAADNELWALDFSATTADGGATVSWKKLTTTGAPTVNRGLSGWAWDKEHRLLFVYGGTDASNNVVYSELYQLDVATLTWTQRTAPGSPGPLYQLAMAWDSAQQRVVAGEGFDDTFQTTSSFYTFDPSADGGGWSPLLAAQAPSPRGGAVFLGDALPLHVWGGLNDFGELLDDVYRLDESDAGASWTRLVPANPPLPRFDSLAVSIKDRRFIFGGVLDTGVSTGDVFELSADAGWLRIADGGVNFSHPGLLFGTGVARE